MSACGHPPASFASIKLNRFIFPVDVNCDQNDYKCSIGDLQCIPWLWVCDGDMDCNDGSDETKTLCSLLLISICKSFLSYHMSFSITGDWECYDGSFKCLTGKPTCIHSTLLCDKFDHCSDGSDENEKSCGR